MHKPVYFNRKPVTDRHTNIQAQPQTKTPVVPATPGRLYEPHAKVFGNYNLQNFCSEMQFSNLAGTESCSKTFWHSYGHLTGHSALGSVIRKAKVEADGGKIHSDCY